MAVVYQTKNIYATVEAMRRAAALLLLVPTLFSCAAFAEEESHVSALRSLTVNRSLLMHAEEEYRNLQEQAGPEPEAEASKRLVDLRYKIQALNDDAERLRSTLPADKKADEFLEAVVRSKTGERPIDAAAEKRVDEKVNAIYRLHEKALIQIAERRFDQAERTYEEIVLLSPDDDEAYLLLGHTCLAAGRYEKAASAFRSAMHIDPSNAREIPRLYENILLDNPSDDEAMTQLGYAYLLLGGADKARLAFQDALELNPANIEARKGLMELPQI